MNQAEVNREVLAAAQRLHDRGMLWLTTRQQHTGVKEPEGAKFPIPVRINQFRRNGELGAAVWITVRRSTLKARVNGTKTDYYVKNG